MTQVVFAKNESEISPFLTIIVFVQHTELYLSGLKAQYKHKTKLPLDMVSKHVLLSVQRPD